MQLTVGGLIILLLAVPLFLASAYVPTVASIGYAWLLGFSLLAILDALVTRRRAKFEVERLVDEKLSLGALNRVRIRLRSRCDRGLRLHVKDTPPVAFDTPIRDGRANLSPYSEATVVYTTVPTSRGDFEFGSIYVRGLGRWRLSTWQKVLPIKQAVKVYPDLLEVQRYELLARADRLQEIGFRTLRVRGQGTQFESLREYVPDDGYRGIDWKATARYRKPIVREYDIERSQNLVLMIETGRMMTAEVAGMSKLDYAVNAALMLAHVACATDDAVGLITFGRQIESFVPPRKGRAQVGRILDQLYAVQPTLDEPNYGAAVSTLAERSRKRALVVIFSDLVDADASQRLLTHIMALRPRYLPLLVTIRDLDLEAIASREPREVEEAYQRAVGADALAKREAALALVRSRGALVVDVPAAELTVSAVNEYLQLKAAGRL